MLRAHAYRSPRTCVAMSLERFGFSSSASSVTASTSLPAREDTELSGPPVKRRRFNSAWKEGREWLNYDVSAGVTFCDWCRKYGKSDVRNQFITGSTSMKLESVLLCLKDTYNNMFCEW